MREGAMSDIMYEGCKSDYLSPSIDLAVNESVVASQHVPVIGSQGLKKTVCDTHYAERVLKPRVHSAWVDVICPGKLPYAPKPLEYRAIDDVPFQLRHFDKAVDGASKFLHELKRHAFYD